MPKGIQYCTVDPADYQKSVSCPAYGSSHTTGTVTETFDAEGDVLTSTDATGATTTNCYYFESTASGCAHSAPSTGDGGNPDLVYTVTAPAGTVTAYTYNGAGQVLQEVQTFGTYSATTVHAYAIYTRA